MYLSYTKLLKINETIKKAAYFFTIHQRVRNIRSKKRSEVQKEYKPR